MQGSKAGAHAYIDEKFDLHLARIQEFVRQPTISTEDIGIVQGAYMLSKYLREAGFQEVELVDVGGKNPGVWAWIDVGAKKTIASYGFFDSRSVGGRPWSYLPFCGSIVNDPAKGRVLIGRGSSSPKGPLVAWINSLEAMIKTDSLPVNVMLLIEGEEICGSPNYARMMKKYLPRLVKANACFAGGMTQSPTGGVSVNLGYRGLLYLELVVTGEKWRHGPMGMALHSALKNCIHSPASRLSHVLACLTDETGASIKVKGLEDKVLPPSAEDLRLMDDLLQRFGEGKVKDALGLGTIEHTVGEVVGRDLLMRYTYAPSLNINGIYSGYSGQGTETLTVPEVATARIDMRLPLGLTCEYTIAALRKHLDEHGFEDVEIKVLAAADGSRTPVDSDIAQAVIEVYRERGLNPTIWPYLGGGGPWSLYRTDLGLPMVQTAGLGGGGRRDRGDEYLIIDGDGKVAGLADSEKSHIDIVFAYASR